MSVLAVDNLMIEFGRRKRQALRGISFEITEGERVGLIGESGSGKSVTGLAIMGLLPETATVTGSILLKGQQVIGASERFLSSLRADEVGMVFQEPMTALDPTMKVARQIAEVLRLHRTLPAEHITQQVYAMMNSVGLDDPERIGRSYPHQLSGGQRQRCVLAMALINQPDLIICDEPTTALDVTVQTKVLRTLDTMLTEQKSACLFISHDLAVVSQLCSRVLVMLDGTIVEEGQTPTVFTKPQHPYTQGLVATTRTSHIAPGQRLPVVEDFYQRVGLE